MLAWITFGFLIGLQHALEADHIAAVASLGSTTKSFRNIARHGAVWGLGHALTLALFGGAVFGLRLSLDARLSGLLELLVGVMLVALGSRVIYRLVRDRIHFHVHRHREGDVHIHAHSHAGDVADHRQSTHEHRHLAKGWRQSFGIGMMHGLAGSAALVALTASTAATPALGIAFMLLFGLGSTVGMAAFSTIIAVPLALTANTLTWANRLLQAAAGLAAFGFGLHIMYENAAALVS